VHLIADMEQVIFKDNGDLDKGNPALTHVSDALGYWVSLSDSMAKRRKASPAASASPSTPVSTSATALVARLRALSEDDRKAVAQHQHAHFVERAGSYRRLLDAYEGIGGFLDGEYLVKYPNELPDEYTDRQAMARYHNYYRALVNIYVRHVFRKGVVRTADGLEELQAWWTNVDGAGTDIDRFMMRGAKLALAAGISGALVDKEPIPAVGPSKADDVAQVIASWFTATSILDWIVRAGELRAVKLQECAPRASILDADDDTEQMLVWVAGEAGEPGAWVRLDADGDVLQSSGDNGAATLDFVPLAIVRPDPSAEQPFLGYALGGDGKVFVSLLNRCSEEDQVLRDQAFSILACNVGKDGDVAQAKQQLGTDIGTTRALVTAGDISYVTADMAAPEQIRKNIEFLIREIYRMAHVRFEEDSKDAQSGESIRLQFTELNEQLANLAGVLEDAELQMARAWYAWTHPGDRATVEAGFAAANVSIQYPREFFLADLLQELQKWANAIKMDLGPTFEHYIKNRVVDELAPGLAGDLRETIKNEIEGQEQNRDRAMAEAQARFGASMAKIAGTPPAAPPPGEPKPADEKAAA
jgi:hypothetical protein